MKITFDIECTPEEARAFLGFPDVKPMQDAILGQMQARMMAALTATDPQTLLSTWFPAQVQNIEQIQKLFWSQLGFGRPERGQEKEQ